MNQILARAPDPRNCPVEAVPPRMGVWGVAFRAPSELADRPVPPPTPADRIRLPRTTPPAHDPRTIAGRSDPNRSSGRSPRESASPSAWEIGSEMHGMIRALGRLLVMGLVMTAVLVAAVFAGV